MAAARFRFTLAALSAVVVICCILQRLYPGIPHTIPVTIASDSFVIREYVGWRVRSRRIFMFCQRIVLPRVSCRVSLNMMLLCGGIHPNTGPVKNPCSICDKDVRSNQKAILCDGCSLWSHCKCNSVDVVLYNNFMSLCCFDWYCTRCLFGQLPFAKDSFADDQDVQDDTTDHDTESVPEDLFLFNGNLFTSSGKSNNSMVVSVNKSVNIGLICCRV